MTAEINRFVEVNRELAASAELLAHRIVGHQVEDFRPATRGAYRLIADAAGRGRHRLTVRFVSNGNVTGDPGELAG